MRAFAQHNCATIAAVLVLFFVLSASNRAAAQKPIYEPPPAPTFDSAQQTYTLRFQGVETAAGAPDDSADVLTGLNYAGEISGPLRGALSVSLKQKPSTPDFEIGNELIGDTWSLVVFKGDIFQGVLYGEVSSGWIGWNRDLTAYVKGSLFIKGGTGRFASVSRTQGNGWFELTRAPDRNGVPIIAGTVELRF
ncbi:MAG: hypothetical protein ACJ74W_01320 [Pyrinomonadaceae bacterium]